MQVPHMNICKNTNSSSSNILMRNYYITVNNIGTEHIDRKLCNLLTTLAVLNIYTRLRSIQYNMYFFDDVLYINLRESKILFYDSHLEFSFEHCLDVTDTKIRDR